MLNPSYRKERYRKEVEKRRVNPAFRMKVNLSERMRKVLKGSIKAGRTHELLGCSREFFVQWIEQQLRPGMTWQNYGRGWVIDHRVPCAAFNLEDPDHQRRCFHYTNLQPLWWEENEAKKARIIRTQPELPIAIL